jgi:hypothetical protein
MGWTLALLVLREMLPSDGASAPSINGVVGSSLYISRAVDILYFSSRSEKLNFRCAACRIAHPLRRCCDISMMQRSQLQRRRAQGSAKAAPKKLSSNRETRAIW